MTRFLRLQVTYSDFLPDMTDPGGEVQICLLVTHSACPDSPLLQTGSLTAVFLAFNLHLWGLPLEAPVGSPGLCSRWLPAFPQLMRVITAY